MKNILTLSFISVWLCLYKTKKAVLVAFSWLILLTISVSANAFSNPIIGRTHHHLADEIHITGRITDESNTPLPAVTVKVQNTNIGTITTADGRFELDVPANSILVISALGYQTQKIKVGTRDRNLKITLSSTINKLDEVVAIGYGTIQRKSLTGAVSSISAKELKDIPVTSVLQAMEGQLAGVHITTTQGGPDADMKVHIRGRGSITQSSEPLFIVDGFRISNINDIPVSDIKSIDVLKDAASTAIYGAEGSNGVVLITTKTGEVGNPKISINTYVGLSRVYNLTNVLSPYEYVYYQKELDPGSSLSGTSFYGMYGLWKDMNIYKSKRGINWQDSLFGNTGVRQNYNLSLSGGSKSLKYNINYTRDNVDYIMLNSAYQRDYVSAKLDKKVSSKIDFKLNTRIWKTTITGPSVSDGGKLRDAIKYGPVKSLSALSQGDLIGTNENINSAEALSALNDPIYNIVNQYKKQVRFNTTFNAGFSWKILDNLTFNTKGSYAFIKDYTDNVWLNKTGEASSNGGQPVARRNDKKGNMWSIQNTLNYRLSLMDNKHNFSLLIGQEIHNSQSNEMLTESKFYPRSFTAKDVLAMWNYGTPQPTYTTIGEPSRSFSYFARLNYIYNDRYIFSLSAREDGKNVFAPKYRWGLFPGISFAWRLSQEEFFKENFDWVSNAKLRLSYGEVGNAHVGSYWRQQYEFQTYGPRLYYIGEKPQSALQTSSVLKNERLGWETAIAENIGLDLGFLNQRFTATIDLYKKTSKNLILSVPLPSNSGYESQYQNVGSVSNKGIEFSFDAEIINRNDFHFSANFNIAFNKSIVDNLYAADTMIAYSNSGNYLINGDDYRVIVGKPVGLMYGYVLDNNGMYSFDDFTWDANKKKWNLKPGVPDASFIGERYFGPGHIKLKKLTKRKDDVISPDLDRTVLGVAQPKFIGGFSLRSSYKGFDLSVMFNFVYGNDIYNANKIDNTTFAGAKRYQNVSTLMTLSNRFTTIDPKTGYNIFSGDNANPELLYELNKDAKIWNPIMGRGILTNWAIEDGSFLRLSNLTIGYSLPARISRKILMQRLRFYVTGNNLFFWTAYSGQDPEVDTGDRLTPGLDWSAYPKAKTIVLGLNITF